MTMSAVDTATTQDTDTTQHDEFDRACRLLEDELGASHISPTAAASGDRRLRAALIRAMSTSLHIRSVTEAWRVVHAAAPFLTRDGECTEAAVVAVCGPLYGNLTRYQPATQQALRGEARDILTTALAVVADSTKVH